MDESVKMALEQDRFYADITDGRTEEIAPIEGSTLLRVCAAFGMMINNFTSVDENKLYFIKKNGICSYDAIEAQRETKTISYRIGIRALGDWNGKIKVPKNATNEQIRKRIEDACEFYVDWQTIEYD